MAVHYHQASGGAGARHSTPCLEVVSVALLNWVQEVCGRFGQECCPSGSVFAHVSAPLVAEADCCLWRFG